MTRETLFGQALSDLYHGRLKGDFSIRDEGGIYPIDIGFYLTALPDPHELEAIGFARGRILDVGCGAGRILKWLQDRGMDAAGFDLDPLLVQVCLGRGIRNVVAESYDHLDRFAPVDTILWLNRTLGTAGTMPRVEAMLRLCHSVSVGDGVLVFDSVEVKPELANVMSGVLQNTLQFQYAGQVGDPFQRIYFTSWVAETLLERTGWHTIRTVWNGDIYAKICRRSGTS